jgi:hypothetical protein
MANLGYSIRMAPQAPSTILAAFLSLLTLRSLVPTLLLAPRRRKRLHASLIAPQRYATGKLQVRLYPDIVMGTKGW